MGRNKPLEENGRFPGQIFPSESLTAAFVHLSDGDTSARSHTDTKLLCSCPAAAERYCVASLPGAGERDGHPYK